MVPHTSGFTKVDENKRWCWASPLRFVLFFPAVILGGIGVVAPIDSTARWALAVIGLLLFLVVVFDTSFNLKSIFKKKVAPVEQETAPLTGQLGYMHQVPMASLAPDPSAPTFSQYPVGYHAPGV